VRAPSRAATSPLTWGLAAVLFVSINLVAVHTPLIWGKTALWVHAPEQRLGWMAFWQVYDVARTLYRPRRAAPESVAIVGNSLVWIPAQPAYVERELQRVAPQRDIRVDNLSFFGAHIGDMEIVSRDLERLHPSAVLLMLGGVELLPAGGVQLINPTGRMLEYGWFDGPLPAASSSARVERWLATASPLYRFRKFARAGLRDRLFPTPEDENFPDHLASPEAVFTFIDGAGAPKAIKAYDAWRHDPTLDGFADYLRTRGVPPGVGDLPETAALTPDTPGVAVLDRLFSTLAAGSWKTVVILMPENPLLDADTDGRFHRLGFSDRAATIIQDVAAQHGLRVVDGRRWLPATAFIDFQHLFPDVSGFQQPLAQEVLNALDS
jgi:hypothetical protein